MRLIKCGTPVKMNLGGIEWIIISIEIHFTDVKYSVKYIDSNSYIVTIWLHESKFNIIGKSSSIQIGFNN